MRILFRVRAWLPSPPARYKMATAGDYWAGGEGLVVRGDIVAKPIRLAQSLRKSAVPAETVLWKALRSRALAGFKFRRQHPIGTYVVDFACLACKIVVELDGVSHLSRQKVDLQRTQVLEAAGWCVMRFWNNEVYADLEPVKEAIYRQCVSRSAVIEPPSPPTPLPPPSDRPTLPSTSGRGARGSRRPSEKRGAGAQ